MSTETIIAALHALPGMTDTAMRRILVAGAHQEYKRWTIDQLQAFGLPLDQARRVLAAVQDIDPGLMMERIKQLHVQVMPYDHPEYPPLLRHIHSAPPILYRRGAAASWRQPALAVVGTRYPTTYGLAAVRRLLEPVVAHGVPIISGLAIGIDAAAHQVAIESGGATVAVFGTGLDQVYPMHHRRLAETIVERGGALLSEFPIGTPVARHHFPRRNRIISGLAPATLIIEAGEKSGALITAKFAVEQNRELLALPGPIDAPASIGPNNWIRLGATLIRNSNDILESLQWPNVPGREPPPADSAAKPTALALNPANENEAAIIVALGRQPIHIDVLTEKSRLDVSLVSATLSLMEIKGMIRHHGGQFYSLSA